MEALDVVFGIDMSSQSTQHIPAMKQFLTIIGNALHQNAVHLNLGAVKYGNEAQVTYPYPSQPTASVFTQMVKDLGIVDNGRSVDVALVSAYNEFFKPRHNEKISTTDPLSVRIKTDKDLLLQSAEPSNRRKLLVLLVAGEHLGGSTSDILPVHAARLLYDLGVEIMVVAFDDTNNRVKEIVQKPSNLFELNKGQGLPKFMQTLCEKYGIEKPSPDGPIDIAFLLDSSASMYNNYEVQSKIVENLASRYGLSVNGSHASIVIYSHNAQIELLLKNGLSMEALRKKLADLPFLGLDTRLDRGLYLARMALFNKKYGARDNVPKILYIFTDGEQSTLTESALAAQAEELRKLGVQIVIVGVGGAVDQKELEGITGQGDKIYYADLFKDLVANDTMLDRMVSGTLGNLQSSKIMAITADTTGSLIYPGGMGSTIFPAELRKGPLMDEIAQQIHLLMILIKSGLPAEYIAQYFKNKGSLPSLLQYHRQLTYIFNRLSPALKNYGQRFHTAESCRSLSANAILNAAFNQGQTPKVDILTRARQVGGNYFVDLLWATGLAEDLLTSKTDHTLFVPSDDVFKNLPESLKAKLMDTCYLRKILRHHIVKGRSLITGSSSNRMIFTVEKVPIMYNDNKEKTIGGYVLTDYDLKARYGLIHTYSGGLLLPPSQSIQKFIISQKGYNILSSMILDPFVEALFKSPAPLTLFAPSDKAFGKMSSEDRIKLLSSSRDLINFLKSYIVKDVVYSRLMQKENPLKLVTLNGKEITLQKMTNDQLMINNKVLVTSPSGVTTTNVIVHTIDELL